MEFPAIFKLKSGSKVLVARKKDFVRGYHFPIEEAAPAPVVEEKTVAVEVPEPVEAAEEEEESAQAVEGKARFEEMKAGRYWTKGEEEAAEYQRMKVIHG